MRLILILVAKCRCGIGGKAFADHASHLVVHGVLHLAGYDHERPRDAKRMGPLEVKILKALGIADPYAATDTAPKTAKVK